MDECTCTYGAYVKYAGGTGWDIARYDPECPEHGAADPYEYEERNLGAESAD